MNLIRLFVIAVMVCGVTAGSAVAGEKLSTRAIKQLFPGQFSAVVKGYAVKFVARRDGSLIGTHMASKDTGRWSVRRGRLCIMLKDWLKGKTKCSPVVQSGSWYRTKVAKFRKL